MQEKIIELLIPILLGWVMRATGLFGSREGDVLRRLVLYFCIPLLIFFALAKAPLADLTAAPRMIIALVVLTALRVGLGFAASLLVAGAGRRTGVHTCCTFANYGWLGYGAAYVLHGDPGLLRVVFFLILWWPVFYAAGLLIGAIHLRGTAQAPPWSKAVWPSLPALSAVAVGLLCNVQDWMPPEVVAAGLRPFAQMAVPLILFSVGLTLEIRGVRKAMGPALLISVFCLLLAPGLGWLVARMVAADDVSREIIFVLAAMPVAVSVPLLAESFELDLDVVSTAIVVSTLWSLLTLPLIAAALAR